jgi:propionyl-CoA carboxylase alpha chain
VVAVHVAPGDQVSAGDALVVLEAMKMEHRITADADASVVEVVVAVGDAVDAHEVLVVLEPLGVGEDAHADH